MQLKRRTCPQCGRPYLPFRDALLGAFVFFGFGLNGAAIVGGVLWYLFDGENAKWVGMLIGSMLGAVLGIVTISRKFKRVGGGEYCQCTDGA